MGAHPSINSPWPAPTPGPSTSPYSRQKKRRKWRNSIKGRPETSLSSRQTQDSSAIAQAKNDCQVFSGNNVISCFPTSSDTVAQHEYAAFVWNSRRPEITQTNLVDVYLFHGDSNQPILHFPQVTNPSDQAGYLTTPVNDTWFSSRTANEQWSSGNISLPFYWVLMRSDQTLDGSQQAQATFQAVQTTYLDSVSASMASTSAAAASSSASVASVSSQSVASVSSAHQPGSSTGSTSGSGSVQSANSGDRFPHWAIAVITVLGFLALLAAGILCFLFMRRLRRRDTESSNRGSMGSATPIMAQHQANSPQSPLLGATAGGFAGAAASDHRRASSIVSPDGASSMSHTGSAGEGGPFSGADAAIMADAFRKALRKPDFAGAALEEGDSPSSQPPDNGELMHRELGDEGRELRSVESSRGVQVETLSDTAETAENH